MFIQTFVAILSFTAILISFSYSDKLNKIFYFAKIRHLLITAIFFRLIIPKRFCFSEISFLSDYNKCKFYHYTKHLGVLTIIKECRMIHFFIPHLPYI